MSFLSIENLKIIYDHVCKLPQYQALFPPNMQNAGKLWFEDRIQVFIQHKNPIVSSTEELRQLNRKAFEYVLQNLLLSNQPSHSDLTTVYSRTPNQQNYSEYEQRQREYDQMLQKPAPATNDFPKSLKDEPIDNLEEEIRKHIQARDSITFGNVSQHMQTNMMPISPQQKHIHWEDADTKMVKIEGEIQSMKERLDLFLHKLDIIISLYQKQDNVEKLNADEESANNH